MTAVPPPATDASRRVRPLLAATLVSVTGDGAFFVAAPLLAATLTTDPVQIGVVVGAFSTPWLVVGLLAGALVDRWPRRLVMICADLVRAALLGILGLLVVGGHVTVMVLVVTVLLVGTAQCFFDSATQATIPALVGRDRQVLTRVNGWYWSLDSAGRSLIGPPLGSAAFVLGRAIPFVGDAVTFVFSAAMVALLPETPRSEGARQPVFTAVADGVRFTLRTGELKRLFLAVGGYNFGYRMVSSTLVLYTAAVLHLGAVGFGLLFTCAAVGGIAAGWMAPILTRGRSARAIMAGCFLTQAGVWAVSVLAGNPWVTGVMFVFVGAASSLCTVAVATAQQQIVPSELMGRIASVARLISASSAALGAVAGGVIAATGGLRAPLIVSSIVLVVIAVVFLALPGRRDIITPAG